jgi:hypothetical protein
MINPRAKFISSISWNKRVVYFLTYIKKYYSVNLKIFIYGWVSLLTQPIKLMTKWKNLIQIDRKLKRTIDYKWFFINKNTNYTDSNKIEWIFWKQLNYNNKWFILV